MKDTYNSAIGYVRKARESQTEEQRHRTLLNLFLRGKLCEAILFVCEREKGGFLQPEKLAEDRTGTINKTITSVLEGKYPSKKIPSCATLEMYEDTPIFIPVDIKEEAVESVARYFLGSSGPGGMDSEALQVRLLIFGEDSTRLRTSMENFVDWSANGRPPWAAYSAFMSGCIIMIDKKPGVQPVGVGETRRPLFSKIVLKVTGPEATMVCHDEQLCAGLKTGIDSAIHRVQALWNKNSNTKNCTFLIVDANDAFNDINKVRMLWTVRRLCPYGARFVFN